MQPYNLTNNLEKPLRHDRNFDEIADHFSKKVYGSLKGQIRLAVLRRDLLSVIQQKSQELKRPLRILDVGAGLAQLSIEFAQLKYDYPPEVFINDISANMLDKAKQSNTNNPNIHWYVCPYQQLDNRLKNQQKFDLILNHAVLEWLAEPKEFISFANKWLISGGHLSLCFYNPASFIYRNLMLGNFNIIDKAKTQADNKKSLTPNHPVDKNELMQWVQEYNLKIQTTSGLRVFYDYTTLTQGGLKNPASVIEMELKYSQQEPFKWLGRYLHFLLQKP